MQREMININANLISEVQFTEIDGKDGKVKVANFTLFRKTGKEGEKKKEYINCNVYGEKSEIAKDQVKREDKEYRNFIITYFNKIEKEEKNDDVDVENVEEKEEK